VPPDGGAFIDKEIWLEAVEAVSTRPSSSTIFWLLRSPTGWAGESQRV
jgi:hypothetical protein